MPQRPARFERDAPRVAAALGIAGCLCFVCLPVFAAVAAAAPSELRGLLRETGTQKPISGAMIAVFDLQNGLVDYTYTTANGAFALPSPATAGKYRLEAYRDKLLKS